MRKIKNKGSIFKTLILLILILIFIQISLTVLLSTLSVNIYYMNDLKNYMNEQKDTIIANYDEIDKIKREEYSIYNMRLEKYDTKKNAIVYSSFNERIGKQLSSSYSMEELNAIFDDLVGNNGYSIYTIEDEKYNLINSLLNNDEDQIIMIAKYKENQYFALEIPSPNIVYAVKLNKQYSVLTSLMSLVFIIPITFLFSYIFVKPIKNLCKQTQKIKDKDFNVVCNIKSNNEIGELAENINSMSKSIQKYIEDINEKNNKLIEDIRIKEQFEESQKKFISNVSHEINTPISIISAYTESLKYNLLETEEEKEEYYNIILDECSRMNNITKQLLYLSKLENPTKKLNITTFNIIELLKIDVNKFKLKCNQNDITINLATDLDEAYVEADAAEIENVIINYLQNAFKYCLKPGKILIKVEDESELYKIIVYNNSKKIPEEKLEKIWDRFYKEDKSRTRNENSTGLGLSIVKATMNLHKMPCGVYNVDGGIEFFIKLKKHIKNI